MVRRERRRLDEGLTLLGTSRWVSCEGMSRMAMKTLSINRAPVLTLWAAVVARRLGFDEVEALTLGKAVAGLNAQSRGRRLGNFKPHEEKAKKAREKEQD